MRLIDYFAGVRVELASPLPAEEVAHRINRCVSSSANPFARGVVGRVWRGHLRLRYRSSIFDQEGKPVLVGRISGRAGGSCFVLRYRGSRPTVLFYLFWYLVLAHLTVMAALGRMEPTGTSSPRAMIVAVLILFFFLPIVRYVINTRRAPEELLHILRFLAEHALANPEMASRTRL